MAKSPKKLKESNPETEFETFEGFARKILKVHKDEVTAKSDENQN